MMRVLAAENAAARAVGERADAWARARGLPAISEQMYSGREIPTELFAVQSTVLCADVMAGAALAELEVKPDFVTGHSFGDYAALVFAGVWSLEDALDATRVRCEAIVLASRPGGMSSVSAPFEDVRAMIALARARGHVEAANVNAPDQVVVAGEPAALEELERIALSRKIETTRLAIPRAFHSAMMREAREVLASRFSALRLAEPKVRYLSSVTGRVETSPEAIRAALIEQLTLPVDFVSQVTWLLGQGVNVFVECGPRGVLAGLARRIAGPAHPAVMVTSDDAQKPGRWALARVLAGIDSLVPEPRVLDPLSLAVREASEPGFAEFWRETQPFVARFVESLFAREHRAPETAVELPEVAETMSRWVVRAVVAPAPEPIARYTPRSAFLLGSSPRAAVLARVLAERGTKILTSPEGAEAIGIVLDAEAAPAPWSLDQLSWSTARARAIDEPFRLLRAAHTTAKSIFAVTSLGGGLGFENAKEGRPEHGAVLGLLKAIRREFPAIQVQALDASPSEDAEAVARALLAELDAGSPKLEVGLLRKKRIVLAISARRSEARSYTGPRVWVITGGARGVTAKIALELAKRRPELHLFGKHVLPAEPERTRWAALSEDALAAEKKALLETTPKPTPLEWKARCETIDKTIEIEKNLAAIAQTGARVHYHAVDVADRAALARELATIKAPIEGLIHGSGVEIAKSFDKKTDLIFEATVGAKVDGLIHLLHLLKDQPLSAIAGFSSVSGRFGGHGQTDYSAANEAMARILSAYRARNPERNVFAVAWPAFSEVGLAARGSAKIFLERAGQSFMTPAEGALHLLRELATGGEAEIVISDRPGDLDADHAVTTRSGQSGAMLGHLISSTGSAAEVYERRLEAQELFLAEHRMNQVPILPMVTMLEALVELSGASVERFVIHTPVKVPQTRLIRMEKRGSKLTLSANAERSDGVVLEPWRVHAIAELYHGGRPPTCTLGQVLGPPFEYPYASQVVIQHGPSLQVVRQVTAHDNGGRAILIAPDPRAIFRAPALLPVALLDGCLQAAGLLARLRFNLAALPESIARFHRPLRETRPGQEIRVAIAYREQTSSSLSFDLVAEDEAGVLFALEGYRVTSLVPAF